MPISQIKGASIANGTITVVDLDTVFSNGAGGFQIPGGTIKPTSGVANGTIRFDSSNNRIELYSGSWLSVSGTPPTLSSITGNIFTTAATTLNVAVSSFGTTSDTLEIYDGATLTASISATSSVINAGTGYYIFTMPSAVFNKSSATALTCYLKNSTGLSSSVSKTVETARSCKALLDAGTTTNGTYTISNYGTITPEGHYCLQDASYNGGGWTLLLTMTNGNSNFTGSSNPFVDPGSVGSPSLSAVYTRNRANTFTPAVNDQFLIRKESNADWVRFVISTNWVAGSSWDAYNSGHNDFANGQTYNSSGSALSGFTNFNCCTKGGNCGTGGGDGCGFGTFDSWCDNSTTSGGIAYGFAFNGATNGGANTCWGVNGTFITDIMTFWYRKNGTQ